ncbi:hypothetical protein B0I37DRAFT_5882 [Chaetomium sp. MPI-CAGE-AT-0009]|nr:hypothetical protein B0I37DRAFT_5882 [Chaetomium sp. MPI-CAGE-AT-0009]
MWWGPGACEPLQYQYLLFPSLALITWVALLLHALGLVTHQVSGRAGQCRLRFRVLPAGCGPQEVCPDTAFIIAPDYRLLCTDRDRVSETLGFCFLGELFWEFSATLGREDGEQVPGSLGATRIGIFTFAQNNTDLVAFISRRPRTQWPSPFGRWECRFGWSVEGLVG